MSRSITILCGFPGSGKSSYLRMHSFFSKEAIVLCPDDFRWVLTGKDFHGPAEESVWSHVKVAARVLAGLKDRQIVIDGTHLTVGSRAQWIRIAQDIRVPIHCIYFDIPYDICQDRNKERRRVVPDEIMQRMFDDFVAPSTDEGLKSVSVITLEMQERKRLDG